MRRAGAAQTRRARARAKNALADLEEKEWVKTLQTNAVDDAEKAETVRLAIQRRLILRGRLDPHDIPEAALEQEELLPRLRRHIRTALALEAQRRVVAEERDELVTDTDESPSYPSWTPLWIHLSWRPAQKPQSAALRAAKKPGAAALIQKRYRRYRYQYRSDNSDGPKKLDDGYMGAPDDPVSGRRMKMLFYVLLLVCWTLASADSRQPDKYHQTAVLHTHFSISSDLESPPKSFATPRARRLQTGANDETEVAVDADIDPDAPTGGDPQFTEIHTRDHLKHYMKTSLRRAAVELAQSASPLPFHTVTSIRIRQQRVKPRRCVSSPFDHLLTELCYPNFHEGEEDKTPFGPDGQWEYTDGSEVRGYTRGSEAIGRLGPYDLGGFVLEVFEDDSPGPNSTNSSDTGRLETGRRSLKGVKKGKSDLMRASGPWVNQEAFDIWSSYWATVVAWALSHGCVLNRWSTAGGVPWDNVVENNWIDAQTRAVIIDATVYNPALRIVTVARLLVEITDTGKVMPTYEVHNMRQRRFFDASDFESWCEWALLMLIGLLTIRDLVEGASDAHAAAEHMLQGSIDAIGGLKARSWKPDGVKSGAKVVPADAPAPLGSKMKQDDSKAQGKLLHSRSRRHRAIKMEQEQQARIDAIDLEIEEHRQLEIRQRLLGELLSRRVWRAIDLLNYALFLVPLVMEGVSRIMLHNTFEEVIAVDAKQRLNLVAAQDQVDYYQNSSSIADDINVSHLDHVSFYLPGYLSTMATTLLALNAVPTWGKMIKYLAPFPYFGLLTLTLQHAYYETLCFLILFFNVFIGWGMAFSSTFGSHMVQYSTVPHAMMSLFRLLLGDYEFNDMYEVDGTIASILFVVYNVLMSFLLTNMFVALMSNSYMLSKIRVFGDLSAEQNKSKWAGTETFLQYVWRMLTDHRPCRPCLSSSKMEQTVQKTKIEEAAILWVGRIPEGATEAGLMRLLSRFGHPNVYFHTKIGKRKSWAIARFDSKYQAKACFEAANPSESLITGLVLPAIETTEGVDVELKVKWSSESTMAKRLVANPNGNLAEAWFDMQMAGAVGTTKGSDGVTWSPYVQTTLVNAIVRGEEKKMFALLEETRAIDELLRGPQKRKLDKDLDWLTEEARYLQLSVSPAGVRARKRFQKAGLAALIKRRLQGYQSTEVRQDLARLAAARALGMPPRSTSQANRLEPSDRTDPHNS